MDYVSIYEALLIASPIILLCVTALYVRSGRGSIFHPATIYIGFHAIVFVFRPILAYINDYDFMYKVYEFSPSMSDKVITLAGANLGFVTFVAAAMYFGPQTTRFVKHSEAELSAYFTPLTITCLLLGPVAIWSLYYNIQVSSGAIADTMISDRVTHTTINTSENGYLQNIQMVLPTLVGLIAYINRFKWWSLLPFAVYVLARGATGVRGPFIAAVFFMILLYMYSRRREWFTPSAILLFAGGWGLFRLVGDDRGSALRGLFGYASEAGAGNSQRFLESMDYANMEFFEFAVYCIPQRTHSWDYFASISQVFTEPIPRVWWPGKPVGAPIQFFNLFDCGHPVGMTFSLPGAGWFELGWLGIIIWCAFFAWIYATAYKRFQLSSQSVFGVLLYCSFAITTLISFRDGIVLTILKQALFYMMPVVTLGIVSYMFGMRPLDPVAVRAGLAADRDLSPRERRRRRATELDGLQPRLRRQRTAGALPCGQIGEP